MLFFAHVCVRSGCCRGTRQCLGTETGVFMLCFIRLPGTLFRGVDVLCKLPSSRGASQASLPAPFHLSSFACLQTHALHTGPDRLGGFLRFKMQRSNLFCPPEGHVAALGKQTMKATIRSIVCIMHRLLSFIRVKNAGLPARVVLFRIQHSRLHPIGISTNTLLCEAGGMSQ